MYKQVKLGRHKHNHNHRKHGQVRSSCGCADAYFVALTNENGVEINKSISTEREPIIGHFDPDLMRTYQKQNGGRFLRYLVYHRVKESWYRELNQCAFLRVGMSLCLCLYASESQALAEVRAGRRAFYQFSLLSFLTSPRTPVISPLPNVLKMQCI